MGKVIVCGLIDYETLRAIETFLDDEYEIAGYADIVPPRYNFLRSSNFYSIEQLKDIEFDHIILGTFSGGQYLMQLVAKLNAIGCLDRTVMPIILRPYGAEKMTEDKVRLIDDCTDDYYGVIMGLSYSLKGLDKPTLARKFFELSWSGQDMYYNMRLLQYGLRHGKFLNAKQALLIFPHYFFDYDQSRSYGQYESGQIFSVHALNDWRNASKIKTDKQDLWGGGNHITNYRLFGKKLAARYKFKYVEKIYTVCPIEPKRGQLPKGFFKDYPETVEENRAVFRELIMTLYINKIATALIVPPLFVDVLEDESLKRFDFIANKFHTVVREELQRLGVSIQVFDFSRIFQGHRALFRDIDHLNSNGAIAFAQVINQLVLKV